MISAAQKIAAYNTDKKYENWKQEHFSTSSGLVPAHKKERQQENKKRKL
jgi:hypothetical protein